MLMLVWKLHERLTFEASASKFPTLHSTQENCLPVFYLSLSPSSLTVLLFSCYDLGSIVLSNNKLIWLVSLSIRYLKLWSYPNRIKQKFAKSTFLFVSVYPSLRYLSPFP
jgi:hypothetical protein